MTTMKNVIIFGAGSAIAQATGRRLARERANLVLIDKEGSKLQIVADDLRTRGATIAATIAADLTLTDQHQDILRKARQALGTIDIVLISYGTLGNQQQGEKEFTVALKELQINFISVVSLLTEIANNLLEQGHGLIAVISSVAGDRGRQSNYIYGSAKGGLTIFLQGLRNRLAARGVHVLTIKPGFVDTPMTASFQKGLLWVKPEVIGRGIIKAIKQKKNTVYLPWFWRYLMLVIKAIPDPIFKKMPL